jgi:AcrR family transcriptional regulator
MAGSVVHAMGALAFAPHVQLGGVRARWPDPACRYAARMARNPDSGLIWARPEPSIRKPRFSREMIAAAALEIADAEGFEAVSMRDVAAALGAATMTLYNYVRTKDDLVALMHDAIMAEILVPAGEMPAGWREAVTLISCRVRAALVRHPWAVGAMQEAQPGPNAVCALEQFLAAVDGSGLTRAQKYDLLTAINAYVFGNVLITVGSRKRTETALSDPDLVEQVFAFTADLLKTGEFPHTAELLALGRSDEDDPARVRIDEEGVEAQFLRGLAALLDGLTSRFAAAEHGGAAGAAGHGAGQRP